MIFICFIIYVAETLASPMTFSVFEAFYGEYFALFTSYYFFIDIPL